MYSIKSEDIIMTNFLTYAACGDIDQERCILLKEGGGGDTLSHEMS